MLSEDDVLAGAKFYARATAVRALHGIIPEWDDEADEKYWKQAHQATRDHCLDMVRGIVIACEFREYKDTAFKRALAILDAAGYETSPAVKE